MGNPVIRRLRGNTFANGPIARANDGAVLAELQGNAAKRVNIIRYETYHTISSQVVFFGDNSLDVSFAAKKLPPTSSGVVWAHRMPRNGVIAEPSLYLPKIAVVGPGLTLHVRLMKSDRFPSSTSHASKDMGEELLLFEIDTSAASSDTTFGTASAMYGASTVADIPVKAGDFLFLYSTFVVEETSGDSDFAFLQNHARLSLGLSLKEEHL